MLGDMLYAVPLAVVAVLVSRLKQDVSEQNSFRADYSLPIACLLLGLTLPSTVKRLYLLLFNSSRGINSTYGGVFEDKVYNLDHWKLNVELPPKSMWMNMGYWEDEQTDFNAACVALLEEVLKEADIYKTAHHEEKRAPRLILDLGFGCGDQTSYLTLPPLCRTRLVGGRDLSCGYDGPICDDYIGLINNPVQLSLAEPRIRSKRMLDTAHSCANWHLFCADAGDPKSWASNTELWKEINEYRARLKRIAELPLETGDVKQETWVLGLDSMYHFSPSRKPTLSFVKSELHASLMAYDLCLADDAPLLARCMLYVVSLVTSVPYNNFLTIDQYRKQLVEAGYSESNITVRDISPQVFVPLVAFLERQETELTRWGLGFGPLKAAKWIFGWWARSGVVRGCIVVAKA